MSEQLDRRQRDFSKFDSMTTEALQQILRLDSMKPEGEESDTEELLYIMEVLADRRRRNDSTYTGKTAQQAFEDFQKYYMLEETDDDVVNAAPAKQSKLSVLWLRRIASIAAALAIVFLTTITANAFGFDLFGKAAKWSKEFFHFEEQEQPTEVTDPDVNIEIEFSSLQQALNKCNISQKLAPTWLPDGYVLSEIKVSDNPHENVIYTRFTGKGTDDKLSITIRQILSGPPLSIEKSNDLVEVYSVDGIAYYIFQNNKNLQVCWVLENFECFIIGNVSIDEMKKILDSI